MSATHVDGLTAAALAGLAYSPSAIPATGSPVDQLALPGEDAGRDLLLRAGAAAVYRAAGRLAQRDAAAPEPAPEETRPPCPLEASAFIESLLATSNHALLPEALARVERAGYLLPPSLLPLALDTVWKDVRPALVPLIGERGRWLARFNPVWAWAAETLPGEGKALPPDAETIWQEGATAQRVALLARLRASDPARAREWVEGVWKQEKAETRASMLETFATGLSLDDELLLDSALSERGERVRAVAARLLTDLPASALAGRIRDRADAALTFDGVALDTILPNEIDPYWTRDGLQAQPPTQANRYRVFWLAEMLERVPPSHWEEHFGKAPVDLIAATAKSKWRVTILHAWTDAAARFQDSAWAAELWGAWLAMPAKELESADWGRAFLGPSLAPMLPHAALETLAPMLPHAALESLALRMMAEPKAHDGILLNEALGFLPRPWSLAVARAYLDRLRAFAEAIDPEASSADPWGSTLNDAAVALPESVFAEAREPIAVPESKRWQIAQFSNQLEAFAEIIRLRERLVKVLPL